MIMQAVALINISEPFAFFQKNYASGCMNGGSYVSNN